MGTVLLAPVASLTVTVPTKGAPTAATPDTVAGVGDGSGGVDDGGGVVGGGVNDEGGADEPELGLGLESDPSPPHALSAKLATPASRH